MLRAHGYLNRGFGLTVAASRSRLSVAGRTWELLPHSNAIRPLSFSVSRRAVTADELQALAARISRDRELAARLATSSATSELLRAADSSASTTSTSSATSSDKGKQSIPRVSSVDSLKQRLSPDVPAPTQRQKFLYFVNNFLPFVGFGFCDNAIMLLAGDFIDAKFGLYFGISTMCAAAVGNLVSDIVGMYASGIIETMNAAMGVPVSGLTAEQRADIRMRIWKNTACCTGITVGCIIGMFPLAFPQEWRLWESRENLAAKAESSNE